MNNITEVADYEVQGTPYIVFVSVLILALLVLIYLYIYNFVKWYVRGPDCGAALRLAGQTVVVTGGTSGVGRETAKELSRRGARLILLCRDLPTGQGVAGEIRGETMGDIQVEQCDLSSLVAVRLFAAKMLETEAKVDILVNCAGVLCSSDQVTREGNSYNLTVNYLAPFLLAWLLQPLLRRASPGPARVINVVCSQYIKTELNLGSLFEVGSKYKTMYSYGRSKLCLVLASREMARRLDGTRVNVYMADPGTCRTNLGRHSQTGLFCPLFSVLRRPFLRSPANGAQTLIFCALDKSLEEQTGLCYKDCLQSAMKISEDSAYSGPELWLATTALLGIP